MKTTMILAACLGAALLASATSVGYSAPRQDTTLQAKRQQGDRAAQIRAQIDKLRSELSAIQRQQAGQSLESEKSVKPGINKSWRSSNIEPLIKRLESESREIFAQSDLLAAVAGPLEGSVVADIGAGSGFMSQLFAKLVGDEGKVYAVDINAKMMKHLADAAKKKNVHNIQTVVCTDKSAMLPANSVDLVFICDTYHHFEYPRNTLASIYKAVRPGGQLVLVEFQRIPGVSRKWILGHVRAGEQVFTDEIVSAGFELINAHYLPQLKENYVLRFRKP